MGWIFTHWFIFYPSISFLVEKCSFINLYALQIREKFLHNSSREKRMTNLFEMCPEPLFLLTKPSLKGRNLLEAKQMAVFIKVWIPHDSYRKQSTDHQHRHRHGRGHGHGTVISIDTGYRQINTKEWIDYWTWPMQFGKSKSWNYGGEPVPPVRKFNLSLKSWVPRQRTGSQKTWAFHHGSWHWKAWEPWVLMPKARRQMSQYHRRAITSSLVYLVPYCWMSTEISEDRSLLSLLIQMLLSARNAFMDLTGNSILPSPFVFLNPVR